VGYRPSLPTRTMFPPFCLFIWRELFVTIRPIRSACLATECDRNYYPDPSSAIHFIEWTTNLHFIEWTTNLAAEPLPVNNTSPKYLNGFHAARFVRVSHYGSITIRLPGTLGRSQGDVDVK
jgi:hypothetical protein